MITVDYHSLTKKSGHDGHSEALVGSVGEARERKAAGEHWGDVIPAIPEKGYAGLNLTVAGRNMLQNGCSVAPIDDQTDTPSSPVVEESDPSEGSAIEVLATSTDTPKTAESGMLPETGSALLPLAVAALGLIGAGITYVTLYVRRAFQR